MTGQGDLLPFASPETVLAHIRQLERRYLAIAPEVSEQRNLAFLEELAMPGLMLDAMERETMATPAYRARQQIFPVIPLRQAEATMPTAWRLKRRWHQREG